MTDHWIREEFRHAAERVEELPAFARPAVTQPDVHLRNIKHGPTNAHQISYPGGKNGFWHIDCAGCDYYVLDYPRNRAEKRINDHVEAKNK